MVDLKEIQKEIDSFSNHKPSIFNASLKHKLDRSLSDYEEEINKTIAYLLSRDATKVKKYIDKMNAKKGEE